MGFFDKIKGAVQAVTGGATRVSLEVQPSLVFPGDEVHVKIIATSTGNEVKSKGTFVDLKATEEVKIHDSESKRDIAQATDTIQQTFQIAGDFVLAPNETKTFEGTFRLPQNVLPTYSGTHTQHVCRLRGRIEAFGNDPDSGFNPIRVGSKA
jgi:sporulation-control protein spo0M